MKTQWTHWTELPWLAQRDDTGIAVQLYDRTVQTAIEQSNSADFLQKQLPDIATGLSVQWASVVCRDSDWQITAECGRRPQSELPYRLFEEALDRDAAALTEGDDNWSVLSVPLKTASTQAKLLVLAGRALTNETASMAVFVSRAVAYGVVVSDRSSHHTQQLLRMQKTLEATSKFAGMTETQPLLELIAQEATGLLNCDRASIFIWDREHGEVVACPALGVADGTLRLPDNLGIVGKVIHTSTKIVVDDAYRDDRFDKSVDQQSGYTTKNLLCVPLLDAQGTLIGAFEVINKQDAGFQDDDDECLTQLGVQAAVAIQNTREREQLIRSREQLTEQVWQGVQIIGESPAIVAMRSTTEGLALNDLPVLILGESGTGKEVVSQALHYQGPRADHPFIAVNCAALTESLLESELFGHEKGAFTDARETRAGKFELADGGTLFLDEIGDMSLGGQAKLLRVLEQKTITRVGGAQAIPINVRVVAATNKNLAEAVHDKRFREDLYYRLSVVTLDLPPLRERPEDILLLAEFFLKKFSMQARRPTLRLSTESRRRLQAHAWPGNVRELRNLMERVCFLSPGDQVESEDLAFILSPERNSAIDMSADLGLNDATKRFQQEYIRRSVKRVNGNMSEAAKLLGLHRSNLYRKMRQLDMDVADEE